jgi:hypothetical protein
MITRIAAFILMAASLAFAADPFVGTWKPDLEKSKFLSPAPSKEYQSRIHKIELVGPDTRRSSWFTPEGQPATAANGQPVTVPDRILDGKEHIGTDGFAYTAALLGDRHVRITARNSRDVIVTDAVISADGRVMTVTVKGVSAAGRKMDDVLVYTKQ